MRQRCELLFVVIALAVATAPVRALDYSVPEKFVLKNGLRLIVKEDHSMPLVGIALAVHAGSMYETRETNGYSHLLAKLWDSMIEDPASAGVVRKLVEVGSGVGTLNDEAAVCAVVGATSDMARDGIALAARCLALRKVVPAHLNRAREKILRQLASRMAYPREEGIVHDMLKRAAFGEHPLGNPTMGDADVIRRATPQTAERFLAASLAPSRAILVVQGDVRTDEILAMVQKSFDGSASPFFREDSAGQPTAPSKTDDTAYSSAVQNAVAEVGFLSPSARHSDYHALYLLLHVLARGQASSLHRRLVAREGLAKSISGDLSQLASTNLLTFQIVSTTDDARTAARAVIEECARIARQGIDAQALENARQMCKSLRALDRQHETQRAFSLASAELVDSMDLELDFNDRMDRVTPEDLQRVARETLSPRRAIFVQIRPKSAEAAGVIGTQSRTLPSGVTVVFKKDTSTEVVGVALYMHGSATNETKPGLAGLLEELLSEARTSVEPPEVTQSRLERCGAVLRCGGGGIAGIIPSLNATVYTFDELLQTLHDIAVKPRFDEEPFERVRRKVVDELKERSDDPEKQGSWRLWQVFYPKETSGAPAEVAKSLQACTSGDVKAYHAKVLASRPIVVAVSGNLSAQRVFDRVEQVFADVPRPEAAPPQAVKKPKDETIPPSRVRLETIETPRPYDTVWVGFKLPASSVLDIAPMTVWMNLLILADQSMCSVKVREFDPNFEKRIAGMNTLHFGGVLAWGFRVKSGVGEKVAAWLEEFVATIPDIEVPSDRAESARRLVLTAFLRRFQDKVNHSRTLAFMMSLTNDPGFFDRLRELYEKMPDLKRVARQYFSEAYIVLYKSTARPTGGSGK